MDILDVLRHGAANTSAQADSTTLRACAEIFLDAYRPFIGYDVVAASPTAERVLGAAMMLRPTLKAIGAGPTVILDINIASGTLVARAARRLRDNGNSSTLVAVVLNALVETSRWDVPEIEQVVVADAVAVLAGRQETEGSGRRFVLAS
jgi:hypothetical protein